MTPYPLSENTTDPWVGIGLMSGTSLDGIDACAVEITPNANIPAGHPGCVTAQTIATLSIEMPHQLRTALIAFQTENNLSLKQLLFLDQALGNIYAQTIQTLLKNHALLRSKKIQAIGCHGQTVAHYPPTGTLQLGDPHLISTLTGIPVVSHFRQADMATNGQGAPLVPFVDALLYASNTENRCLVNIGGICNLTVLPKTLIQQQQPISQLNITAHDTGPGNMLIDQATQYFYQAPFDPNGQWAAQGTVQPELIEQIANLDLFLHQPIPKSTGREHYGNAFFKQCLALAPQLSANHWIATLTEYTAYTLSKSCPHSSLDTLWLSGGGAQNDTLVRAIQNKCSAHTTVKPLPNTFVSAQYKEAFCFAILAWAFQHNIPANIPSVTGAKQACILGRLSKS